MKKKFLIYLVACLIAAGSFVHINFAEYNHNTDISLADIIAMALADGESGEAKYCWTNVSLGGLYTNTPCVEYNPNYLPPYRCGSPISFSYAGGTKEQCTDSF